MSTYYRRKKYLQLKRLHSNDFEGCTVKRKCPSELPKSIVENTGLTMNDTSNSANSKSSPTLTPELLAFSPDRDFNVVESSARESPSVSYDNDSFNGNISSNSNNDSEKVKSSFRDKVHALVVRHISHTTKEFTTDLLQILREDGHRELPKSAATLLKSNAYKKKKIKRMKTKCRRKGKKEYGAYVYFGIADNLKRLISPKLYKKRTVKLLINVDGLPVYNHSTEQLWPILMLVFDPEYESAPFLVAAFCGKSKPKSVDNFLKDFIAEIKELLKDGIDIDGEHFTIEILGFVCDTPARAFLKCTKGHGGFFACERCEVEGISIKNIRGNKKRVYAKINAKLRTKKSFRKQRQKDHHKGRTPLLNIPDFDPVRGFLLDSMHLLYIGVMKFLLEEWLSGKNRLCKISASQREYLRQMLLNLTKISDEFQRKDYDLDDLSNWKATQYRFFLHYSSVACLREILKKEMYDHFMLLFVASRILCSPELAVTHYTEYARCLLKSFVTLFPSFYGEDSQNIVIHNLIHLADDVDYTGVELPAISAFVFENSLRWIKEIIRGNSKPLQQLVRRVAEIHSCPVAPDLLEVKHPLSKRLRKKEDLIVELNKGATHDTEDNVKRVLYKDMIIQSYDPENVVQLDDGKIIRISNISYSSTGNVFLKGHRISKENLFQFPCNSEEVGVYQLGSESKKFNTFDITRIKSKFVVLTVNGKKIAVSFLHDS